MLRIAFNRLLACVGEIFVQAGLSQAHALEVADMFVVTEAAGIHSHGLALIPKHLEQMLRGTINRSPAVRVRRQGEAFAMVDGDAGPGPVVLNQALDIGMDKARRCGTATVWITNLQHHAAGFYHVRKPVGRNFVAMLTANAPASVAPYGGKARLFGTNPLTFGAPAGSRPPYILDMATSVVAGNKVEQFVREGRDCPSGYGIDRHGNPTTDPAEILQSGALLPFGGAKGSGISGMVDILSGILSGGGYMDSVVSLCRDPAKPASFGCRIDLTHIPSIMDRAEYDSRMEEWTAALLACPPAPGFERVLYPGYHEGTRLADAISGGVQIPESSLRQLAAAGNLVGMDAGKELASPMD